MIYQFLALLATHWVADFVCQTHWQATNKSKDNYALAQHVMYYAGVLLLSSNFIFPKTPFVIVVLYVAFNAILHFATDYITSRITSKLWAANRTHDFFVVVGLDQLIHQTTLALTMIWLCK